jgi:hypothetical protein
VSHTPLFLRVFFAPRFAALIGNPIKHVAASSEHSRMRSNKRFLSNRGERQKNKKPLLDGELAFTGRQQLFSRWFGSVGRG